MLSTNFQSTNEGC